MASLRQLKKQLVHAAVIDNVDLIRNRRPVRATRSAEPAPWGKFVTGFATAIALLVLCLAAFASTPQLRSWIVPSPETTRAGAAAAAPPLAAQPIEPETIVVVNPAGADALHFDQPPTVVDRGIFALGLRTIVIDPGHGGSNHGTEKDDLREKDLTLDIALRLEQLLSQDGFDVVMTRRQDRDVELDERVDLANRSGGDLFVSIHVNWLGRAGGGVETFYLGTSDDPRISQLAATENRESGYTLKDFRNLLDGLYVDLRRDESRSLAGAVQEAMHGSLQELSPNLRNRGVKTAPFVVLIGTEMPAILAEVSSLSDAEEARLLRDETYRQRIAEALRTGVVRYAESLSEPPPTAEGAL